MRVFAITTIITMLGCSGCVSEGSNQPYESSYNRAIALNGFWDGQFDQAGAVRLLMYEGNVYGFDGTRGFTGTVEYISYERSISMDLDAWPISGSNKAQDEMAASGAATSMAVDALLVEQTDSAGTIVGTFETSQLAGGLTLEADGSWEESSALWKPVGTWKAGTTSVFITELGSKAKFVGQGADSCSFNGELFLLNSSYPLMKAHLYNRSDCKFFNKTATVNGYAAITAAGTLEFYFADDSELLRLEYSR